MEEKVITIINDFLLQRKEKDLKGKVYEKIKKSNETEELKEKAKEIIDPKEQDEKHITLELFDEKCTKLLDLKLQDQDLLSKIKSEIDELQKKYNANSWISYVAKNAGEVSINVTHISKLTHSSAKGSNINSTNHQTPFNKEFITTESIEIEDLNFDFSYLDSKLAPVAEFLQLDCDGKILGELIQENPEFLRNFTNDDEQIKNWIQKINLTFDEKNKFSHALLKQVYFPLKIEKEYHLISPLISSSMAQVIYNQITSSRNEKNNPIRKARNNEEFSDKIDISFPKTAILKTTQTNHQNVSNLNGKRSGQLALLSSQPPQWQKQNKPPIDKENIFDTKELSYQAKDPLSALRNLLVAIRSEQLIMNLKRKQLINGLIEDIIDILFIYISEIQNLEEYVGWSQKSTLPEHQKYWLDPYRAIADEDFRKSIKDIDWKQDVMNDFAKWINDKIRHKKLTIGVEQEKYWKKQFKEPFRESLAITDALLEEKINMEPKYE